MGKTVVLTGLLLLSCFIVAPLQAQMSIEAPLSSSQKTNSAPEKWVEEHFSIWDAGQNGWNKSIRRFFVRNAQDQPTEILSQTKPTGTFRNEDLFTYYFSPVTGQLDSMLEQTWNGVGWQNYRFNTYLYDSLGTLKEQNFYLWHTASNAYTIYGGSRTIFQYGPSQEILSQIKEFKSASNNFNWTPSERYINSYDANLEIDTIWHSTYTNGAWVDDDRTVDIVWFDYNQNLKAEWVTQQPVQGLYENYQKNTIARTPLSQTSTKFDWINNTWIPNTESRIAYDAQGREELNERFSYSNGSFAFAYGLSYLHAYNPNGDLIELTSLQAQSDSIYNNNYKIEYFYPVVGLSPSDDDLTGITLFPNPFADQLQLRSELAKPARLNFVLMDAMGKIVFEQAWNASAGIFTEDLKLPQLPKGIYYYSISDGINNSKGKLTHP